MANPLIDEFASRYMESVYYFCLKKTGDSHEAEDLTSDIALHIVGALQSGTVPTHFHAWMWRIAHNRYSRWAAAKCRRVDTMMPEDIAEYDTVDPDAVVFRDIEDSEELASLRRELAFIASDYREILVAYYFNDRRIKDIAASLSLPEGTVTSKLYRARHMLKEGMKMARTFGVKSYKPEEVRFVNSCSSFGSSGQPWSVLNHLLFQNILLETYGNPQTAKDLALELGVALPYMESELEFLTNETFLSKEGDTYQTTFAIISKEAQTAIRDYNASIGKDLTAKITDLIDVWADICATHGFDAFGTYQSYEDAKWSILPMVFDNLYATAVKREPYLYTCRPDGGKWDIVGFQATDFEAPPFVGHHTSPNNRPDLPPVTFGQYKYHRDGIFEWTPVYLTHAQAHALHCVVCGKTDDCESTYIDELLAYGYIRQTTNGYEPAVVVIREDKPPFTAEEQALLAEKANAIRTIFVQVDRVSTDIILADLPASYRENAHLCDFACRIGGITREWVVEQAIADGWLTLDDNTSKVIGAHIQL